MINYFFDSDQVRYELVKSNGGKALNWLFFPGGPGADSSYYHSLIDLLELPGNVWCIDLPGNGSNTENIPASYDFNQWSEVYMSVIKRFDNPVVVGHSFGGMFPLLFPELESILKGFVILNSAPSLWLERAAEYAKQFSLPDLSAEMAEFTATPTQETFRKFFDMHMSYYFPSTTLEKGRALLEDMSFQIKPAAWWQRKAQELKFSAIWVPQSVPTVIVGGKYDCICPFSLFQEDQRFKRDNIDLYYGEEAGHFGWIESPKLYRDVFSHLVSALSGSEAMACL